MQMKLKNQMWAALLCALVIMATLFVDSSAQQQGRRRRRPSRRAAHPAASRARTSAASPAQSDSPEIISTDDASANGSNGNTTPNNGIRNQNRSAAGSPARTDSENEVTRRTLNKLSMDADYERLSRAEQRTENLNAQLRDVVAKQADLQARAEQIDIDLQPGNIENSLAGVGTLHPEELRAQRRRQLESEKTRVRNQLDVLDKNRASLETSIAGAETEANRLRQRVDAANAAPQTNTRLPTNNSSSQTGTGAAASPSPSPSPNDSRPPR